MANALEKSLHREVALPSEPAQPRVQGLAFWSGLRESQWRISRAEGSRLPAEGDQHAMD